MEQAETLGGAELTEGTRIEPESIVNSLERLFSGNASNDEITNNTATNTATDGTGDGVVAIIYNKEAGELAFEQKSPNHADKSVRGLLQFIGGHVEYGESSLEALIREFGEEAPPESSSMLIKALKKNGYTYTTQTAIFGGKLVKTDIVIVEVESSSDWQRFKDLGLTSDAGNLRVLKTHKAYRLDNRDYAYEQGPILKEFIMENLFGSHSNQKSGISGRAYSDSFVPPYADLGAVNNFFSTDSKPAIRFCPIVYRDSFMPAYNGFGIAKINVKF
ncbi:NUDIX domain-containing protein [Candidatus Woesearchaeota archaeon]|nr:NUDIX domain-containing protein [Candidatus Woesearchaeota archaeon]